MLLPKSTTLLLLFSTAVYTTTAFVPTTGRRRLANNRAAPTNHATLPSPLLGTHINKKHISRRNTKLYLSTPPPEGNNPDSTSRPGPSNNPDDDPLEKFGVDFTARAAEGKLDPVIGRDDEIRRAIQILSRRTKNNPVLIGDPGVGE